MTACGRVNTRQLTHVEMLYRPGERELAKQLFELLGCKVLDRGNRTFSACIDPEAPDFLANVLYASEVTPEQWRVDQALAATGDNGSELADAVTSYLGLLKREPQWSFHFGLQYRERDALDATLDRIRSLDSYPLAGRVRVSGVFEPGAPGSVTDTMLQAFVWTDVVAAGLLTLGQHIELQWHVPR
jgi:hypothetical protein